MGVQLPSRCFRFAESSSTLSPQFVLPLKLPSPVVTRMRPVPGTTTAPERAQIADPVSEHVLGWIRPWLFEHSALKTRTTFPDPLSIRTTWPW